MYVLDLFTCEGGASHGYVQSGMTLLAAADIDARRLKHHPYPDRTVCMDWKAALDKYGSKADLIHASPPCQHYSVSTPAYNRASHPDLVSEVRKALIATGKPYVIENVPQAPLNDPTYLTGCMFGLKAWWRPKPSERVSSELQRLNLTTLGTYVHLERRRGFETNWDLRAPAVDPEVHAMPVVSIAGNGVPSGNRMKFYDTGAIPKEVRTSLMGMSWGTNKGMSEAIPPAYARYIGEQFQLATGNVCEVCSARFKAKRKHARTCSDRCRMAKSRNAKSPGPSKS